MHNHKKLNLIHVVSKCVSIEQSSLKQIVLWQYTTLNTESTKDVALSSLIWSYLAIVIQIKIHAKSAFRKMSQNKND